MFTREGVMAETEFDFADYFENKMWQRIFKQSRIQEGEPIQVAQLQMDKQYIVKKDFVIPGQIELRGGTVIKASSYSEQWLKDAIARGLELIEYKKEKIEEPKNEKLENVVVCPHCGGIMEAKTKFGKLRKNCVFCSGQLR
jgi:ssDNA-binding Zn-finger/Zn-ribbon topoisomerase 1